VNPLIQLKHTIAAFLIVFGPVAQAVVPAPDGGYPGRNTAEGQNALFSLTTGSFNTAVGWLSLETNSTGDFNTSIGAATLASNTADGNTATGTGALLFNTTGSQNTAGGAFALFRNTTAGGNVAVGYQALASNTTAGIPNDGSVAVGYQALTNQSGEQAANNAVGQLALFNTTTGAYNNAFGSEALYNNVSGRSNTAIGDAAGYYVTGTYNICIGANVYGAPGESYTIHIGDIQGESACYIGGIAGQTVSPSAAPVYIDNDGKLGVSLSSQRFKRDIKPIDKASEAILSFKPVTFHYKNDAKNTPCFGLIAEEVAKVNPALVVPDKEGKPYTVRYDAVNAMLLNEFLKEHKAFVEERRKVEKLEATVAQQHKDFEAAVAELKGQIQKVSAQLELSKAAPQTALNNQ